MRRKDVQPIYAETYRRRVRTRRVVFGIFLVVLALVATVSVWRWHAQQELKKYPVKGVMINQSNGYIDFESLKNDGVKFVYLKATQGAAFTDDNFESNFQRSQGSQLPIGVYHYFSFSSSATAQFKNFVRQVNTNTGGLPICIAIQYYGTFDANSLHWPLVRKRVRQLMSELQRYYQRPIVISASQDVIAHLKIAATHKHQFWVTDGRLGKPNADDTFIQVTEKQSFKVDRQIVFLPLTVFNGNENQWARYLDEN